MPKVKLERIKEKWKNLEIPVRIKNFDADIHYRGSRVANVRIPDMELNVSESTMFVVNLTIFKHNKSALQGFLTDLLVKKNVRMDVWGNVTVNLFGSKYLELNVSFKYNDTAYRVDDYFEALMSGEIDTSGFLEHIIRYSAENISWEIVGENDSYVIIRINESLWSALNIRIFFMRTLLYMEPLNASTAFAIQRLVGSLEVPANGTGTICIEIVFIKNRYLQEFLDNVFHEWEIEIWANTIIDLEIFGVNITCLLYTSPSPRDRG